MFPLPLLLRILSLITQGTYMKMYNVLTYSTLYTVYMYTVVHHLSLHSSVHYIVNEIIHNYINGPRFSYMKCFIYNYYCWNV